MQFQTAKVHQDVQIIANSGVFRIRNGMKTASGCPLWRGDVNLLPADTSIAVANTDSSNVLIVAAPRLKGVVRDGVGGIKLIDLNPKFLYTKHHLLAVTSNSWSRSSI